MQKTISMLLSLLLVLSVFGGLSFSASAVSVLASGEVGAEGDNVIWTLTSDNVLTLSGTGATAEYSTSPGYEEPGRRGPWWYTEYRNRVETVVVEEGITRLGKCLFEGNESLTSAVLPDSLESIGPYVFAGSNLQALPNLGKVTEIPQSAFDSVPLSETLIIPEGITTLGNSCFKESRTKYLVLPSTLRDVSAWYQFFDCPLETVVQPALFIMAPDFCYDRLSKLILTGNACEFTHGRFMYLNPNTEVVIPAGSSYKGFTGLYPMMHTRYDDAWYDWQYFREKLMCFNEEAMGDYDSPEAQAAAAQDSYDYNFRTERYARLVAVDNPAESPIVPDENGRYYNVFGEAKVSFAPIIYTPVPEKAATCTEDGNIAYYTGSDGKYYTMEDEVYSEIDLADTVIPAGHTYGDDDWTAPVFADCGNDGTIGYYTCRLCGERIDLEGNLLSDEDIIDPATGDHDWIWVTDQEPGCYTDGTKHQFCTVCEQTQNEDTPIPAGHTFETWVDAVAPTCGADGTVGYQRCRVCGDYFDADGNLLASIVDPATGDHDYTDADWTYFSADQHVRYCTVCGGAPEYEGHDVIVKGGGGATCGDEGYTGDEFCSVCGQRLSEGEIIPPTGNHTTELVGAREATATDDGYTGDEVCTVCGRTIKQGEVIPATGETTPDEPDDGEVCPFCGKVHTGRFAKWIKIVHRVFAFLLDVFNIVKK